MKYIVTITHGDRYERKTEKVEVEANDRKTAESLALTSINRSGDEFSFIDSVSESSSLSNSFTKKYIVTITYGDRYGTTTTDIEVEAQNEEMAKRKALYLAPRDEIRRVESVSERSDKKEKINYDYDYDDDWER